MLYLTFQILIDKSYSYDHILEFIKKHNVIIPKSWFNMIKSNMKMCTSNINNKDMTNTWIVVITCIADRHKLQMLQGKSSSNNKIVIMSFGKLGQYDRCRGHFRDTSFQWIIRVPDRFGINISFTNVELQHQDQIVIYDCKGDTRCSVKLGGYSTFMYQVLDVITGSGHNHTIYSDSSYLLVRHQNWFNTFKLLISPCYKFKHMIHFQVIDK